MPARALDRLFADDALVEQLILASGGHLRMLLGLAVELITQAEVLPVDMPTVDSSIQQVRNTLLPIPSDQLALLRTVSEPSSFRSLRRTSGTSSQNCSTNDWSWDIRTGNPGTAPIRCCATE